MLFGSALFGVLGALLAIPVAAALQITYREYRAERRALAPAVASTGPRIEPGSPVTPNSPGPTWAPITGPSSDTNSGGRP